MNPAGFAEAIRRTVFPGAVVLDLGGDCAERAVVACRSRAARVLSVQSLRSLPVARALAAVNGCAGTIEFVGEASADAIGHQRVDVILSDARGGIPIYGRSVAGAARRIGSPEAVPIPRREHLFVAVVNAPDAYAPHVSPWETRSHGIDLGAARQRALHAWSRFHGSASQALGEPARWATIDYTDPDVPTRTIQARVEITITASHVAHGLSIWSAIELADEVEHKHHRAFFPWLQPVPLERHDRIVLSLRVDAFGGADVWSWTTCIEAADGAASRMKRFEQSTFWSDLGSSTRLEKADAVYVPTLREEGRIVRAVLAMMSDGTAVGRMAATLAVDFPGRFQSPSAAEETIERLISVYGRGEVL